MNNPGWHYQDADEHGFVSLERLAKLAQEGRDHFLKAFPRPCLRVDLLEENASGPSIDQLLDSTDQGVQLLTVTIRSAGILRYLGKVAFVAKRPGNPYAHLISVGRSASNDISLSVESISRVHGYFVADDESSTGGGEASADKESSGWSFIDHGSTNGSRLDGQDLVSGQRYPLRDGAEIQLGLGALLEFLTPEGLYRRVESAAEQAASQ